MRRVRDTGSPTEMTSSASESVPEPHIAHVSMHLVSSKQLYTTSVQFKMACRVRWLVGDL